MGLIQWLGNLFVLYFHYDREYSTITLNFVVMMYFGAAVRSAQIAAKYATFTKAYRKRLLSRYISDEELAKLLLLGAWD